MSKLVTVPIKVPEGSPAKYVTLDTSPDGRAILGTNMYFKDANGTLFLLSAADILNNGSVAAANVGSFRGDISSSGGSPGSGGVSGITLTDDANGVSAGGIVSVTVKQLKGQKLGTITPTSARLFIADGTQWNGVAMSGDATISAGGAITVSTVGGITPVLNGNGAGGDLTGFYPSPVVSFINGNALGDTTIVDGAILIGHTGLGSWNQHNLSGDVTMNRTGAVTVTRINGNTVNDTSVTSGNVLIANGTEWDSIAFIGDVSVTSSGITTIKNNVALGGNPTATTQASGNNSSRIATTAYVDRGTKIQTSKSAAYTLVLGDAGSTIFHPAADTTARTWTIPANASVAFDIGTEIDFINETSAGVITISITTDTLLFAGAGTTGSRTLAASGWAKARKITSTKWIITNLGGLT